MGFGPAGYPAVTAKGVFMQRVFVLDRNKRSDGYAYA